jgi:hypothetical protein
MNACPSWIHRIKEMIETLALGGAERIDWLPPTPALTHSDEPIATRFRTLVGHYRSFPPVSP